ncbi:MAG: radical SAM protein [Deltaproteobacteria bacterium]|nr:radical SAM protein [Deltaproteobacteria bacterium]
MLEVSDLLKLALGRVPADFSVSRAPARYGPGGRNAPPVVVWNVCRHCNLSCPHCYASAGRRAAASDLSTTEARNLLDSLAGVGVRIVIFSGGEPLLRPDLFDLIAHARAVGLAPQLSTNGTLIDAPAAKRLAAAGVQYVGISIDGLPQFNDPYRGLAGGFALAIAGIGHAQAAGLRTGLRMTLSRRNHGQLEALLQAAGAAGASRFYVSHLLYSGRGRRLAGDDLTVSETRALLLRLFERGAQSLESGTPAVVTGGNDSAAVLFLQWIAERHGAEAAARVCDALARRGGNSAGERILNIDARGRVHPDQFWTAATLGDLRQQRLSEILRHPLRAELAGREASLSGRCGACRYRPLCRGSHRERALAATGDLWAPDPACVMTDSEIGWSPAAEIRGAA